MNSPDSECPSFEHRHRSRANDQPGLKGGIHRTATSKSYEMLLNLIGLLDLIGATGDERLLQPALRACACSRCVASAVT